jgi:hypothetical protein
VAFLGNVAYADKLCCSIPVAPQALYSDWGLWRYAITVISFVALRCKFNSPCGVRINTGTVQLRGDSRAHNEKGPTTFFENDLF